MAYSDVSDPDRAERLPGSLRCDVPHGILRSTGRGARMTSVGALPAAGRNASLRPSASLGYGRRTSTSVATAAQNARLVRHGGHRDRVHGALDLRAAAIGGVLARPNDQVRAGGVDQAVGGRLDGAD